jgi:beta-aspartyl-dipeptidase (metallo-type)
MLLLKGGEVYAPEPMGTTDLLLSPEKILLIKPGIPAHAEYETQVIDCGGCFLCPAFIDQHMHITGGGGEEGPISRVPEMMLGGILQAGVGTVVGLLGADGVTRSVASLLAKARALEEEGLNTYIYTGSYGLPTDTLTGKVLHDIVFVDKVLGAGEVAISDYRSTHPTLEMLRQLAWEVKMGGMIGKKAGILHLHVGDGKKCLAPLTDLIEESNFPMDMFVPTHLNRNKALFDDALRYGRKGGFLDLTAGESNETGYSVAQAIKILLTQGVPLPQITFSSDAGGSNAASPDGIGHVQNLYDDFVACIHQKDLPLEAALQPLTKNPAQRLHIYPRKGCLRPGSDADIVALCKDTLAVKHMMVRGNIAIENGILRRKGKYEA